MATTKHVLKVSERKANGSNEARRVRAQGFIPAVIYGKGIPARNVEVHSSEWEALQKYEFNLVTLQGEGIDQLVLVKEVQNNFIKGKANHIDFFAVDRTKPITAMIPIHQGHVPPVGIAAGGLLEQYIHEIEVECLPDALPENIVADISGLGIDVSLQVKDLVLPAGVKAKTHKDIVLFRVINPLEIKEDVPVAAAAAPAEGEAAAAAAPGAEGAAPAAEPEVVGAKEKAERAAAREEEKAGKK